MVQVEDEQKFFALPVKFILTVILNLCDVIPFFKTIIIPGLKFLGKKRIFDEFFIGNMVVEER